MHRAFRMAFPILALVCAPLNSGAQVQTDYAAWIRPYQEAPLQAGFGDQRGEVKLGITAIEGDDPAQADRSREIFGIGFKVKYGCHVSTDGRLSFFSVNAMGGKGGGYPKLPEADLKKLDELLADLPDDFAHLPPPDRRLVLQVPAGKKVIARVYDRANPPSQILEIIRLTQSNIRTFLPTFPPKDQWQADTNSSYGALALAPDDQEVVSAGQNGPFRFWNPDTHFMSMEIPNSPIPGAEENRGLNPASIAGLSFSPDGAVAVVEGWGEIDVRDAQSFKGIRQFAEPFIEGKRHQLSHPQFMPDGHYMMMESNGPAPIVVDTKTWQRVSVIPGTPPGMPPGALAYFPAPYGRRSVYRTAAGEIALWNPDDNRNIALLDSDGSIERLAWSPDQTMVAAVTLHGASEKSAGEYRVRIWNAEDGTLVHELRPFEQKAQTVEGLLWWPDGKYVLAVTKADHFFTDRGVGVWNVKTGRHRAELTGCPTNVFGLALRQDGRLIEGCGDGVIRAWDAADIIKQVSIFETSMPDLAGEVPATSR
jgi:WD40 repeat protein